MTFEKWWADNCIGTDEAKGYARSAWNAAVSEAERSLRENHRLLAASRVSKLSAPTPLIAVSAVTEQVPEQKV